jgi:hypothetical protein
MFMCHARHVLEYVHGCVHGYVACAVYSMFMETIWGKHKVLDGGGSSSSS